MDGICPISLAELDGQSTTARTSLSRSMPAMSIFLCEITSTIRCPSSKSHPQSGTRCNDDVWSRRTLHGHILGADPQMLRLLPRTAHHVLECLVAGSWQWDCLPEATQQLHPVHMWARYYGLKPDIKVISPWREWDLNSRSKLISYAEARGIAVPQSKRGEPPFSMDANLLHISYEG